MCELSTIVINIKKLKILQQPRYNDNDYMQYLNQYNVDWQKNRCCDAGWQDSLGNNIFKYDDYPSSYFSSMLIISMWSKLWRLL